MPVEHSTKLLIADLHKKGLRPGAIRRILSSRDTHLSWSTVKYLVEKCKTGEIGELCIANENSNQPFRFNNVSSKVIDEVREALLQNPTQSTKDVQKLVGDLGTDVCVTTCKKIIKAAGFTHAQPRYCQMIRDVNKQKRLEFCTNLLAANDTFDDVIFSDECSIQLTQNKTTCYRLKGAAPPMIPKAKHPLKIHVWAGISRKGATQILQFEGIMEKHFFVSEVLDKTLKPFIREKFPAGTSHRFQQDNDPKHTSKLAAEYLQNENINWFKWPAESCDFNPIEMLWNQLKRYIDIANPRTKADLMESVDRFWTTKVTPDLCSKYIDHLYKVIPVCILMGGRATADFPNRIFPEPSTHKSIGYFSDKLHTPEVYERAQRLLGNLIN